MKSYINYIFELLCSASNEKRSEKKHKLMIENDDGTFNVMYIYVY